MAESEKGNDLDLLKTGITVAAVGGIGYGAYRFFDWFFGNGNGEIPNELQVLLDEYYAKFVTLDQLDNKVIEQGGTTPEDEGSIDYLLDDMDVEWAEILAFLEEWAKENGQGPADKIFAAIADWIYYLLATAGIIVFVGGSLAATKVAIKTVGGMRRWIQKWRLKKITLRPPYNQIPPPYNIDPGGPPKPPPPPGPPPPSECPVCHIIYNSPADLYDHLQTNIHPATSDAATLYTAQTYFNLLPVSSRAAVNVAAEVFGAENYLVTDWRLITQVAVLLVCGTILYTVFWGSAAQPFGYIYNGGSGAAWVRGTNVLLEQVVGFTRVGVPVVPRGILAGAAA